MPGLSGPPGAVTAAPATPPTTAPTGPPTAAPATTPVAVPALCCGVWQAAAPRQIRAVKMSLRMGTSFAAEAPPELTASPAIGSASLLKHQGEHQSSLCRWFWIPDLAYGGS